MKDCEIIQLEISDKFDSHVELNASEHQHISHCCECAAFYKFVHGDTLNALAKTELVMEPVKETSAWKKVTQIAPFAAAAAIALSMIVNKSEPANSPEPVSASTTAKPVGKNIVVAKLNKISELKDINLESKYKEISNVAVHNWDLVTENISNAKTFITEKPIFRVIFSDSNENPQTSNWSPVNGSV